MSQICNIQPSPDMAAPLFGSNVEDRMAKGSAFFCGAFAEMLHLMAAAELNRSDVLASHLDTAIAYLEASIAEYDYAIRKAGNTVVDEGRAMTITRLDYARLYEESVQRLRLPEIPSIWSRLKLVAHSEAPAQLLGIFRDELLTCLEEGVKLRRSLETDPFPSVELLWALGTRLMEALTAGQAIAVIYQTSLREDAPLLAIA